MENYKSPSAYLKLFMALFLASFWSLAAFAQAPNDGSYYMIEAKHSGKVLDVQGGTDMTENGVAVQQWEAHGGDNQLFRFEPAGNGYYRIIAKHSEKGLDVTGGTCAKQNGTGIQQWQNGNHSNQLFKLVDQGNGYFMLVAKHSGKAIDVYAAEDDNGTRVIQYEPNGDDNQLFRLVAVNEFEEAAPTGVEY